jgi:hypothetical protein
VADHPDDAAPGEPARGEISSSPSMRVQLGR